jgi:hypothetical protein
MVILPGGAFRHGYSARGVDACRHACFFQWCAFRHSYPNRVMHLDMVILSRGWMHVDMVVLPGEVHLDMVILLEGCIQTRLFFREGGGGI